MSIKFGTAGADKITGTNLRDSIYGRGGDDDLSGSGGNDFIDGGTGNDILTGGLGADTLRGGGGTDMLVGGAGRDVLTGGTGADSFTFENLETGDRITDFSTGVDKLVLGFMSPSAFHWIGSTGFSGVAGEARFTGGLFSVDQNGDRVADFSVTIVGQVHASDVIFGVGSPQPSPGFGLWDY